MQRVFPLMLFAVVVAAVLAGCGGDSSSSDTTATTAPPAANAVYERSYTECSSTTLKALAEKYHVSETTAAIAGAVGASWADRFGGGAAAAEAGRTGCLDGLKSQPDPSAST